MNKKNMAGEDSELNGILRDETNDRYLNAKVGFIKGKLYIHIDGYGDACSLDGEGTPVMIDFFDKKLQVLIWSDINKQDPTHIINLKDAKETERTLKDDTFVCDKCKKTFDIEDSVKKSKKSPMLCVRCSEKSN